MIASMSFISWFYLACLLSSMVRFTFLTLTFSSLAILIDCLASALPFSMSLMLRYEQFWYVLMITFLLTKRSYNFSRVLCRTIERCLVASCSFVIQVLTECCNGLKMRLLCILHGIDFGLLDLKCLYYGFEVFLLLSKIASTVWKMGLLCILIGIDFGILV